MKNKRKFDGWNDIDWGIELETIQFELNAITSHNKNNPNVEGKWNVWPQEMEGIMLLPLGFKPSKWSKEAKISDDEISILKQKWLELAQFIDETESISIDENTFTVTGIHGSVFSFDVSTEFSIWLPPNSLENHVFGLRGIRDGGRGKGNLARHIQYLEAAQATWKISTNSTDDGLGFCDFPSHVEGIELKQYESWSTYIQGTQQYFPDSLLNMLKLCIEDYQIWIQLHEHEKDRRKFNEEWNEKWPNGRPDDWMYL